jgi:hypothetical protein
MKRILAALLSAAASLSTAAIAADPPGSPPITVIALYNGDGIPPGWIDSTTREDATDICNKLIASQSKEYANAISRSRCIIQVAPLRQVAPAPKGQ